MTAGWGINNMKLSTTEFSNKASCETALKYVRKTDKQLIRGRNRFTYWCQKR